MPLALFLPGERESAFFFFSELVSKSLSFFFLLQFLAAVEDYDADEGTLASEADLKNLSTGKGVGGDDKIVPKPKKKQRKR